MSVTLFRHNNWGGLYRSIFTAITQHGRLRKKAAGRMDTNEPRFLKLKTHREGESGVVCGVGGQLEYKKKSNEECGRSGGQKEERVADILPLYLTI